MGGGMFDILLKQGRIIDPCQGMDKLGSVAVQDGRIAAVGEEISEAEAERVFDMKGKIIAPGLIDIHCHPAAGFSWLGVPADEIGLNTGVTLLCDAGTSGAANFAAMRSFIVEVAKTDILCFLNLANTGLIALPEIWSEENIDMDHSREILAANTDIIKGVKIRAIQSLAKGVGIKAIELAKKLARNVGLPLMMHVGETRDRIPGDTMDDFSRAAVSLLEKGDILSHYLTWEPGGMILKDGKVYPELEAAQKRGVILDSCQGLNHFSFAVARHAIANGLIPTVISTDMASMVLPAAQSLAVVMSKFINLGLGVDQVIEMTTLNPAKALGEEKKRGGLKVGMAGDITVMELVQGDYVFCDGNGHERINGTVLLDPRMVFKGGEAMPAYSCYHIPPVYA
jgi:dihydroorotase